MGHDDLVALVALSVLVLGDFILITWAIDEWKFTQRLSRRARAALGFLLAPFGGLFLVCMLGIGVWKLIVGFYELFDFLLQPIRKYFKRRTPQGVPKAKVVQR